MGQLIIKENKAKNAELKGFVQSFGRATRISSDDISYSRILQDKLLVANAVKKGVTNFLFREIKENSPFDDTQWSNFLHINVRTLQRYKKETDHVFKPIQSEKIFELAEVVSLGNEVFDTPEHFNIWLNTPSLALGNNKPIDLLDTSFGKDLVMAELNSIEYGIFV